MTHPSSERLAEDPSGAAASRSQLDAISTTQRDAPSAATWVGGTTGPGDGVEPWWLSPVLAAVCFVVLAGFLSSLIARYRTGSLA